MTLLYYKQIGEERGGWLEKRLVWMGAETPSRETVQPPQPEQKKDDVESREKLEGIDAAKKGVDMKEIAERVKTLNVNEVDFTVDKYKNKFSPALKFRAALKEAVEAIEKKSNIMVENLDIFLLHGLLENLKGEGFKAPNSIDYSEEQIINKFLKENKIAKFQIVDGFWKFFDKEGKAVQVDTKLDDFPEKTGEQADDKSKTSSTDKGPVAQFELGRDVKKAKDEDARQKADEEADRERQLPENLDKVSMKEFIALGASLGEIALFLSNEDGVKGKIELGEISTALKLYIDKSGVEGKDDTEKGENFVQQLKNNGFTTVKIENGKIVFAKGADGRDKTSNPLGTSISLGTDGDLVEYDVYAHENLVESGQEKKKQEHVEAMKEGKPKPTAYDAVEKEVASVLTGRKQEELKPQDLEKVDARYLAAMKAISECKLGEKSAVFPITFNDQDRNCVFEKRGDGYQISFDQGGSYYFYPTVLQGADGLQQAKEAFYKRLNNGYILKYWQESIVKNPKIFNAWSYEIDDGPNIESDGSVSYEFDWATGAGDDPDVNIKAYPHGELLVTVDENDIGLNGEDSYKFVAGSFQDMIRRLDFLKRWRESSSDQKDTMRLDELNQRYFRQGVPVLNRLVGNDAGKILGVTSLRSYGPKTSEGERAKMEQGYVLDFDWMQKLESPQRLKISCKETYYQFELVPSGMRLGDLGPGGSPERAFKEAVRLVEKQRQIMTIEGGAEKNDTSVKEKMQGLMDIAKVDLVGSVKVVSFENGVVVLSHGDDMRSRSFNLRMLDRNGRETSNFVEFQRAIDEGYLISRGEKEEPLPVRDDSIETETESSDKNIKESIGIEVKDNEVGSNEDVQKIVKKTLNGVWGANKSVWENYLFSRMAVESDKSENTAWRILAEGVGVELENGIGVTDANKSKIKAELNNPKKHQEYTGTNADMIKGMPRVNSFLSGLLKTVEAISTGDAKYGKEFALAYKTQIAQNIKQFFSKHTQPNWKPSSSFDKEIIDAFRKQIKLPGAFHDEFVENEVNKEKAAQAKEVEENANKAKAEYESRKNNPNGKPYAELLKETYRGVGSIAMQMIGKSEVLDKEKGVFLSKIEGNDDLRADKEVFLNIKHGNNPARALTLQFLKDTPDGRLTINVRDGYNNQVSKVLRGITLENTKIDYSRNNPLDDLLKKVRV